MSSYLKIIVVIFIAGFHCFAQNGSLRFEHLTVDEGLSQNSIYGIVQDKFGFMWFGTWEGVCRYDGYRFTVYRADEGDPHALSNNRVNFIFKDSLENIWIATSGGRLICRFNYESENFTRFLPKDVKPYIQKSLDRVHAYSRIHVYNPKYNWTVVNQNSGLRQVDNHTGEQWIYKSDPLDKWSLNDNITDIYIDSQDILWVGTVNGGVNKADTRSKPFLYYGNAGYNTTAVQNVVRAICQDQSGNLWVGTQNKGVIKMDGKRNISAHYDHNPSDDNSLIDNNIRQIYCDRYGYIWIGTKGGLDRYDTHSGHFYHYSKESSKSIPHNWVFWIMEDGSGYLWVATFNGIAKYNRKDDTFLAYDPQKTLNSKSARVIIEDQKKQLWVGTEGGGITRLARDSSAGFNEKLTPTHFIYSKTNPNSLINDQVLALLEDEDGYLWVGTNSGLCRFDQNKNTFTRFSVKSGLPDDLIMGILSDERGHIWISHKKGITRLDKKSFALRNFDSHDGLQSREFSQNAYFRNKTTGEMFFGGINGFNSFFPDSIKDNPFVPRVVFTGLQVANHPVAIHQKINGRVILKKSLLLTDEIILSYWDQSFSVEFAALHYSNPKGNKYKYRLEGFDNHWINTDAFNRTATYSDLPSRVYYLKVFASNSDGLWNPTPAILKIVILPPWWLTWWAYLGYFIVIGGMFFFFYKYIKSQIVFKNQLMLQELRAEKDKELSQMKLQFFTNVSHELRTPLSLIIDPLEKLIAGKSSETTARDYYKLMLRNAQRLLNLINQLLDFRKLESGKAHLKVSIHDIVLHIKNVASAFDFHASQRNIRFVFSSSMESFKVGFDPDKLDKILYNLISNAFKYTLDGGEIKIELSKTTASPDENDTEGFIVIKITDNGIGIAPESLNRIFDAFYQVREDERYKMGTGIGLSITEELVKLHNGKISVESEVGKGSQFTVLLPALSRAEVHNNIESELNQVNSLIPDQNNLNIPVDFSSGQEKLPDQFKMPENDTRPETHQRLVLIIEDNSDIRSYLKSNIEIDYQLVESINGLEGFEKAVELIPDLIISDIMMPGMNGIELCKKLKTDERTSHIPIILLTAKYSEEYKIEGYETGADAYITKPFSTVVLLARIKSLIESRQRLRELFSKGSALELKKIAINITDEAFINKVLTLIEENLDNTDFDALALAEKLKMSRSQLYNKIRGLTNQTVYDFILTMRMNRAVDYLLTGEFTIAEIAYKVGFTLPTNFTRCFVKQFGKTPSNYISSFKKL